MRRRWKQIKGFPRYEVSNFGEVRSLFYKGTKVCKQLTPIMGLDGYEKISLYDANKDRKTLRINRLVLTAFCENSGENLHAAHLNGDRTDNRLNNLVWATVLENTSHKFIHGTILKGEDNKKSKLTAEKVKLIRKLYEEGKANGPQLANMFGVRHPSIYAIIHKRHWRHI